MKTITAIGFLVLAQQASAQTLPFYDLSYYDSPVCAKVVANGLASFKADVAMRSATAFCGALKRTESDSRPAMEKLWKATPPNIRMRCITELAEERRNGRLDAETYASLEECITTNK